MLKNFLYGQQVYLCQMELVFVVNLLNNALCDNALFSVICRAKLIRSDAFYLCFYMNKLHSCKLRCSLLHSKLKLLSRFFFCFFTFLWWVCKVYMWVCVKVCYSYASDGSRLDWTEIDKTYSLYTHYARLPACIFLAVLLLYSLVENGSLSRGLSDSAIASFV